MREHGLKSVGKRYNRYSVLEVEVRVNKNKTKTSWAKCQCDCGAIKWVRLSGIKRGTTKSCGCYSKEMRTNKKGNNHHNYTHGYFIDGKPTATYESWRSMMTRCYNKNSNRFYLYGAVGIKVCDRWHDFKNFLDDMGIRPSSSHTLDRVDGDKGYSPDNVRWANKSEQAINRKTTRFFTINGETKCLKEWSRIYEKKYLMVYKRVIYRKWDIIKALTKS